MDEIAGGADAQRTQPSFLRRLDARLGAILGINALPTADVPEKNTAGLLSDIERILENGAYGSRFTEAVSGRFQQDLMEARIAYFRRACLIATIIYDLFLFVIAFAMPDIVILTTMLQLCVGTPVAMFGFWSVSTRRLHPTAATIIVATGMFLTAIIAFSVSRTNHTVLSTMLFPLLLIPINAGQGLPFRAAFLTTMSLSGMAATVIFLHPLLTRQEQIFIVIVLLSTAYYSLSGNYRINASVRLAYLYTLRESLRSQVLAQTNSDLHKMVHLDGLTGIGNRRHFDDTVQRIWQDGGTSVAILLIDIDFFKKLNDTYGHQAGDHVLRSIAQALANDVGNAGTVARYGGEEFAVVLPHCSIEAALPLAESLRQSVDALKIRLDDGDEIGATVSIGCAACTPSPYLGANDLVAAADAALYLAKASGRNRTQTAPLSFGVAA